jgi:cell division protein FtsB
MHRRAIEIPPEDLEARSPSNGGSALPLTRRRLALLVAGLFALWLVGVFARQVGDASAAANQADQMRARNAAMQRDITSLDAELQLIKQPAFVSQMARGYLLGAPREIPFTVDPNAPPPPSDAPGAIGIRPDAPSRAGSPLDTWLQALFGSQP